MLHLITITLSPNSATPKPRIISILGFSRGTLVTPPHTHACVCSSSSPGENTAHKATKSCLWKMWKWSAPYSVRLEENKIPVMLWSLFFPPLRCTFQTSFMKLYTIYRSPHCPRSIKRHSLKINYECSHTGSDLYSGGCADSSVMCTCRWYIHQLGKQYAPSLGTVSRSAQLQH